MGPVEPHLCGGWHMEAASRMEKEGRGGGGVVQLAVVARGGGRCVVLHAKSDCGADVWCCVQVMHV